MMEPTYIPPPERRPVLAPIAAVYVVCLLMAALGVVLVQEGAALWEMLP